MTRIKELGLILPLAPAPRGVLKPIIRVDNILYTSGQVPIKMMGA